MQNVFVYTFTFVPSSYNIRKKILPVNLTVPSSSHISQATIAMDSKMSSKLSELEKLLGLSNSKNVTEEVNLEEEMEHENTVETKAMFDLTKLIAALTEASTCGHSVQQVELTKDIRISCNNCGHNVTVEAVLETHDKVSHSPMRIDGQGAGPIILPPNPQVLFSGYRNPQHMALLTSLGAKSAPSLASCHLLVTDALRPTPTLLLALSKGLPIVSPSWVLASQAAGLLLPPWPHLLRDQYSEQHWGVDLPGALSRARRGPLLSGRSVLLAVRGEGERRGWGRVVEGAGGRLVEGRGASGEGLYVVVEEGEELDDMARLRKEGARRVTRAWLLRALIRQKL